ncbi:hypothetical protein BS78_06G105100 [Paspalum vaginatum]|nr:hypothetical protein BS78_06G105100 [Paspalum vaginatum]
MDVASKRAHGDPSSHPSVPRATLARPLADKLNVAVAPLLPGNQAWSGVATVPVSTAMGRILRDLPACNASGSCGPERDSVAEVEAALREMEIAAAGSEMVGLPRPDSPLAHVQRPHESVLGGMQEAEKGSSPLPASPTQERSSLLPASLTQEIHCCFSTPSLPLQPAPPPPRRCRTYDMTNVRRSARLANRPAMPAMRRPQINLCH